MIKSWLFRGRSTALYMALAFSLVVGVSRIANAQDASGISIDQVIVPEQGGAGIIALVSAIDIDGRPIGGINEFELNVDGIGVPLGSVQAVTDEDAGIAVLILLDVSGSMKGEPITQAKRAAALFVEGLREADVAAVVPFGSRVPQEAVFLSDRQALAASVDSIQAEANLGTALYDSLARALEFTATAPVPRQAMILLTDGRDLPAVSNHGRENALQAAATAGIPIFSIGLGENADIGLLRDLAQVAAGGFYQAPSPSGVPAIFDAIGAALRGRYALTFDLPPSADPERSLLVRVELPQATLSAQTTFLAPNAIAAADGPGGAFDPLPPDAIASPDDRGGAFDLALPAVLGGIAVLVVLVVLGLFALRRHNRKPSPLEGSPAKDVGMALRTVRHVQNGHSGSAILTVLRGPNSGDSVGLSAGTVEIGSGPACHLRLDACGDAVGSRHARVWLQGERLMVHHLAKQRETLVANTAIEWATLEPQDTLEIGPHLIGFTLK